MVETRSRSRGKLGAEQAGAAGADLPAANILVIDDEELIRDTLAEYLTPEGYIVTVCASGEPALEEAERRPFAIALCDMQLPGIDGLETLDRLQQLSPE